MTSKYLNYTYDSEAKAFSKEGQVIPAAEEREIPTYIRCVLRELAGDAPKRFTEGGRHAQ